MIFSYLLNMQSHPSWVCGLKHSIDTCGDCCRLVTPFVGVWIETFGIAQKNQKASVTPFVGVWIETRCQTSCRRRQRGHTLRGCVD